MWSADFLSHFTGRLFIVLSLFCCGEDSWFDVVLLAVLALTAFAFGCLTQNSEDPGNYPHWLESISKNH